MTDLLTKNMAPITDGAWKAIEEQAAQTIKGNLALRAMVDFSGPHGLRLAAVNTGRLKNNCKSAGDGVAWSLREALPLIEVRTPLRLDRSELDAVERGCLNPDLDSLADAARRMAIFEEKSLLEGLPEAGIAGIAKSSPHKPVPIAKSGAEAVFESIAKGILTLEKAGINGPYALALDDECYQALRKGQAGGFPVDKRAKELLAGGIRWSPAVAGGLLLSRRGGDFEMTVGQDMAVGYQEHDGESVTLFLTESFTFRVLDAAAAVVLEKA